MRSPRRAIGALLAVLGLILSVLAVLAPSASAEHKDGHETGNPNEDCPAGTLVVAKFQWNGNSYNLVEGTAGVVTITDGTAAGGSWSSTVPIEYVVVKGSTDAKIVDVNGATSGTFDGTGLITGGGTQPAISNVKFCAGDPDPSVSITKTPVSTQVASGSSIGYAIVVTAAGTGTSEGVTVSDTLDAGYTWSEDHELCSITDNVLSCNFGDMASGDTETVNLTAPTTAGVCDTVDNTATVDATNIEGSPDGTDSTGNVITITGCDTSPDPSISISKTPVSTQVASGSSIGYVIVVTAGGTGTSEGVTVSDTLDAGYTWSEDHELCSILVNVLSCNFGDMDSGDTETVTLTAPTTAGVCDTVDNTATVNASNIEGNPDGTDSTGNVITITGCGGGGGFTPTPTPTTAPDLSASIECAEGGMLLTIVNDGDAAGFVEVLSGGETVAENLAVPANGSTPLLVPVEEDTHFAINVVGVQSFSDVRDCVEVEGVVVPVEPEPEPAVAPVEVAGVAQSRVLPRTGTDTLPLAGLGLGLIMLGAGLTLSSRRQLRVL